MQLLEVWNYSSSVTYILADVLYNAITCFRDPPWSKNHHSPSFSCLLGPGVSAGGEEEAAPLCLSVCLSMIDELGGGPDPTWELCESRTPGTQQSALDTQAGSRYDLLQNPCPKSHTSEGKWALARQQRKQRSLLPQTRGWRSRTAEVTGAKEELWLSEIQLFLWVIPPDPE